MDKLNLILIFNKAHEHFYENYFFPSIKDDFVIHKKILDEDTEYKIANFKDNEWVQDKTFNIFEYERLLFIKSLLENNPNNKFLYLDIDIQFLGSIKTDILNKLCNKDLYFFKGGSGGINLGGVAINSTKKTINFINEFANELKKDDHTNGIQKVLKLSKLLNEHPQNPKKTNKFNLDWDYLDEQKYCCGHMIAYTTKYELWKKIPKNIILHHANGTTGIKNKIKQLEYVKNNYNKRNNLTYLFKTIFWKFKFYLYKKKYLYSKYER